MKVTFESPLRAEHISGEIWKLLEPFRVKIVHDDESEREVVIPADFISDGASVPRFPGMYLFFGGRARKAATLHDYLYQTGESRSYADRAFYEAMASEEDKISRVIMWMGVRLGGWGFHRGHARQDELADVPARRPGDFPPDGVQGP